MGGSPTAQIGRIRSSAHSTDGSLYRLRWDAQSVLLDQSAPFGAAAVVEELKANHGAVLPAHLTFKYVAGFGLEEIYRVGYLCECGRINARASLGEIGYGTYLAAIPIAPHQLAR